MRTTGILLLTLCCSAVATADFRPGEPQGMFALYEDNRKNGIPNYVTEDFLLLSYSMFLDQALAEAEQTRLAPAFGELVRRLSEGLAERADDEVRQANEGFLETVAVLLVGGDVPAGAPASVAGEVARVRAAQGIARSELTSQRLDYSQFQIRGRYAGVPELSRYFQAVRYAGSVLFPVVASRATGITEAEANRLTAQALQLTSLIAGKPEIAAAYRELTGQLEWWFGAPDDLGVDDYARVAEGELELPALRRRLFEHARSAGRQPRVLGGLVELDQLEEGSSASDVLTGWRLFPQSFTAESAAFGELVGDRVGSYLGAASPRTLSAAGGRKALPSALELMWLLGSQRAATRLDATDERNFEGYAEASERAGRHLAEAEGLTGHHLGLLRFWLEGDPASDRRLGSALAFWTYHRYMSLLYAKPSYSGIAKGFSLPPKRATAWLEPAPELYAHLAESVRQLGEKADCFACEAFAETLEECVRIAVRERAGLELSEVDVAFLNDLDFELFKIIGERDAPIVVDVHTDPMSGQVMQEGLGWPRVVAGKEASRGALFQHHELKRPLGQRLTDASWARLLAAGDLMATTQED